MRIEEANRLKDNFGYLFLNSSKANLVRSSTPTAKNRFREIKKNHLTKGNFTNINKIQKTKGVCYVCGKIGHKSYQCDHHHKKKNPIYGTTQASQPYRKE